MNIFRFALLFKKKFGNYFVDFSFDYFYLGVIIGGLIVKGRIYRGAMVCLP